MRRYDPISRVFYTCSTRPPIPKTLDFIGFSDGLENQESYVFSPSVLPKIQGMFLGPFFSCFQRKLLEFSFGNIKKFPNALMLQWKDKGGRFNRPPFCVLREDFQKSEKRTLAIQFLIGKSYDIIRLDLGGGKKK